jgi:hypothetical protein
MSELVAFLHHDVLARGPVQEVVRACLDRWDAGERARIAVYDARGRVLDLDLEAGETQVLSSLEAEPTPTKRSRGRPKLGVVSREVSLLPRHWEWLREQRGGASAALRRLVDEARKNETPEARQRRAIDAAHRFLWDIAGDQPDFEEATRSLYAADFARLDALTASWPEAVVDQMRRYLGVGPYA